MEIPGLAVAIPAIPVEDAVGCIGILLNFEEDQPRANRVDPAARQEHRVSSLDRSAMKTLGDGSGANALFEIPPRHSRAQADE